MTRVAIVHDALVNRGGAERVVLHLMTAFPDAPVFTSAYLPEATYPEFASADVRPLLAAGSIANERALKRRLAWAVAAFRRLDLRAFDLVVSSSTFAAKAVRAPSGVAHMCYCYAPFRLLWSPASYLRSEGPWGTSTGLLASSLLWPLRRLDRAITRRIPRIATTCRNMAERLRACYGVEARVIYPPIDGERYRAEERPGEFFLTVSRLNRYKRVDLAVESCRRLGLPLVVVGEGPEREALQEMAGPTVSFAGRVSDDDLRDLYSRCRALIFPGEEDFGIAPLEAQASGRPVVAFGRGGVLESVRADETGLFFEEQTAESLAGALQRFEAMTFCPPAIRAHALTFDVEGFVASVRTFALAAVPFAGLHST